MEAGSDREASLRPVLVLAGTALVLYAADQVTKALVVANVALGDRHDVIGDLAQLWHVRNDGAAFSILPGATWLFVPVTLVAIGMVVYFHRTLVGRGPWVQVVLGAILAGALGNLTDRLRLGYVIDFVSLGFGDTRFPTFNVADSAVVLGIGALVAYLTFVEQPRAAETAR
ncbi:MAG: signal peptidase II [Chloroflexi bacterium]|nr:signal peptidase II [Chloroflexota bacterium]MBA3741194.1 signal peptidase II [Chloroflexota bacterium]